MLLTHELLCWLRLLSRCGRWSPGRFRCGAQGVRSMDCKASGTHRAVSWRRRTARLLRNPIRCSSLGVSRPNQWLVTHGCRSWLPLASENPFTQWQDIFPHFCPRIFSYGVVRVSLRILYLVRIHASCPMVHGNIGESGFHVERRDFFFDDFQVCASSDRCIRFFTYVVDNM